MSKQYSMPGIIFVVENETEFNKAFGLKVAKVGTGGDGCSRGTTKDGKLVIKDRKLGGLVDPDEDGNVPVASDLTTWEDVKTMADLELRGIVKAYSPDSDELKAMMSQEDQNL